jgi:deoxyribose-phosphate aldolase
VKEEMSQWEGGGNMGMEGKLPTAREVAKMIDHSLLRPTITDGDVQAGCELAGRYLVASVCVKPAHVKMASGLLAGVGVLVGSVVGFPHGGSTTPIKMAEAADAVDSGATEIDMVVNIGAVLSGAWDLVAAEIEAICEAIHSRDGYLKVIFENCYLEDEQKIHLCRICDTAGMDWVKTSTGFGQREGCFYGATDADLRLMRAHVSPRVQVKAAGGVRDLSRLLEVRAVGCSRVGATSTEAIMEEAQASLPAG